VNTNSAAATFECMEVCVQRQEALASASSEDDLESKFIKLEAGSEIEDENESLALSNSPAPQGTLPASDVAKPSVGAAIADEIKVSNGLT
jgi:hypothetical protein